MSDSPFVIPPPPPGTPEVKANPPSQESTTSDPAFGIAAAPGAMPASLADSATHKLPSFPRSGPPIATPSAPPPAAVALSTLGAPPPPASPASTPPPASDAAPTFSPAPASRPEAPASPPSAVDVASASDETVAAPPARDREPAASRKWALALPDGSTIALTGPVLIGRDPIAQSEWPNAALLSVDDGTKSVSKTHAMFDVVSGTVAVMDLFSTNGIAFETHDGEQTPIDPGVTVYVPVGAAVELGRYRITLESSE
jgi:hypothetical protein